MKKILLATTALVFSAGLASAQAVSIGGEGRMGIVATHVGVWSWIQENRLQFNFSVSVEGDHGLTFGAFSRARMVTGSPALFSGSRVWVEANGLRLTFGNQDGAIRGVGTSHGYAGGCGVGYVGGNICGDSVGLLGVTHAFSSTGGGAPQRMRVDYTMGDTRVAVSHDRGGATEIGVRSSFDAFTVAAGYTNAGVGVGTISGHYNGGSWGAGLIIASGGGTTNAALSGNVALGGGDLYGYVGRVFGANAVGISYGYGLGGGATATVGAERVGPLTVVTAGVAFAF